VINGFINKKKLRPEFFVVRGLHVALAFGTGTLVPGADFVAATVEAQTSCLAAKGGGDIADNTTYDDVLNRLAVRTTHG
jgi:hypothetical protein